MDNKDKNDLLIRLETKITELCKKVDDVEIELKKRQCILHTNQIKDLRESFDPAVCSRNTEKIATIEKLTWAAILTSMTVGLSLIIKSFWASVTS